MKLKRSYIATWSVFLFAMLLVAFESYTWFAMNRQVKEFSGNIGIQYDKTSAEYDVYMFDITANAGTKMKNQDEELSLTNVIFNPHDLIFKSRNRYTPVFARIVLTVGENMGTSGKINIKINKNNVNANTSLDKLPQECSSLMRFTAIVKNNIDNDKLSDPDALYKYIDSAEGKEDGDPFTGLYDLTKATWVRRGNNNNSSNSKVFTSVDEQGKYSKTESITLSVVILSLKAKIR